LTFNKFDLRDYLWNLYDLEVQNVRSWVRISPVERRRPFCRAVYRPQAKKYMEVTMTQPFVWPAMPDNLEPWNKELWDGREKESQKREHEQMQQRKAQVQLLSRQLPSEERTTIAEMAKKLLRGELKWENGRVLDEKWNTQPMDGGEPAKIDDVPTLR
jgi:large subunit ribosomal protein L23